MLERVDLDELDRTGKPTARKRGKHGQTIASSKSEKIPSVHIGKSCSNLEQFFKIVHMCFPLPSSEGHTFHFPPFFSAFQSEDCEHTRFESDNFPGVRKYRPKRISQMRLFAPFLFLLSFLVSLLLSLLVSFFLFAFRLLRGAILYADTKKRTHILNERTSSRFSCFSFSLAYRRRGRRKHARSTRKHTGKMVQTSTSACSTCKVYHIKIQLFSIILRSLFLFPYLLFSFVCVFASSGL